MKRMRRWGNWNVDMIITCIALSSGLFGKMLALFVKLKHLLFRISSGFCPVIIDIFPHLYRFKFDGHYIVG